MEVYGRNGSLFADRTQLRHRHSQSEDIVEEVPQRHAPFDDPFRFLTAVVRGNITLEENDLSALQVNMIAMEILEAAKRSASTGEAVLVEKR